MSKVLTIRDPSTGTLIAEGLLESKEDKNSALARLYRKVLGPEAPEQVVLSSSGPGSMTENLLISSPAIGGASAWWSWAPKNNP